MFFTPKERLDELKKKYPLTKEDILMFTNIFYDTKFIVFLKVLPPSQFALEVPKPELISYGQRNETTNDYGIEKLKLYFKLMQRGIITIWMNDYSIHNETEKTQNLRILFEKWKIKKGDPRTSASIVPMGFKKNNFFSNLKRRLFGVKSYKFTQPGCNFFLSDLLDEDMEVFMDNLDYGIDINMRMFDMGSFLPKILEHVAKFKSKRDKAFQAEEVFEYIKEQMDGKKNFPGDITISIPLKDYMDNKNHYYDILYELHIKEYLTNKEIFLENQNITFVIHKIHSFEKGILNELFPIEERIRFDGGTLYLDSEILIKGKKKGNKNYELIDLIVRGIKTHKSLEITYIDLFEIILKFREDFPYLYGKSLNKNGVLDILLSKIKSIQNEDEQVIFEKELEKHVEKTLGLSSFNTSLLTLGTEKMNFILKEKTTGIEFKAN